MFRIKSSILELFPNYPGEKLDEIVIRGNFDVDQAINILIEEESFNSESPTTQRSASDFELLPDVLETWNQEIDFDEVDRGFAEFENNRDNEQPNQGPIVLRDSNFFTDLVSRFGQPGDNIYQPGKGMDFAYIPDDLAKRIFDWWRLSLEGNMTALSKEDEDERLAKQLHNEEVAQQLQNQINNKTRSTNVEPDFPALVNTPPNSDFPFRQVGLTSSMQGQWSNTDSLGNREKVNKLKTLFPELPESRLTELLYDNGGNFGQAAETIRLLSGKDSSEIERQRRLISTSFASPQRRHQSQGYYNCR